METMLPLVGLVLGVLLVTSLAIRVSVPAPILLVVIGFGVSFIPGVPPYQVAPDLVLTVLLPPILFGAAFEASAVAIRKLFRPIVQLSVLLVLLTAFTVAFVVTALVPNVPFAAALALGAIVAPPDAVAAVAVARKVGLPRNLVTVLEGESLFNDATSLVTFKVAVAAISAGSVHWLSGLGEFAWASVGGVLIGGVFGVGLSSLRRWGDSPLMTTAVSIVAPFAAYLAGEEARASGVLAVVVAGLIIGHRSPEEVSASVRLTEGATWAALRFVLESVVFALVGLQLRGIVADLDSGQERGVIAPIVVLLVVIISRPVWLELIHLVYRVTPGAQAKVDRREIAALSWAGMRGVVSLAAAQALPDDTPGRALLEVCTIAVIVGTLLLQGLSLPAVIRWLGLGGDSRADDLAERARAHAQASAAIVEKVDEHQQAGQISARQADLMRRWASLRDWRNWDDDDEARAFGQRLSVLSDWRLSLLGIERTVIVGMRNEGELSEEVLREMQHELDLEEALLARRTEAVDGHLDELPAEMDPPDDEAGSGDASDTDPSGGGGSGRAGALPELDEDSAIDDADVGTMMLDESRADGDAIGRRAGRKR